MQNFSSLTPRWRGVLSVIGAVALAGILGARASHALVINATYNGLSATAQAEIGAAISYYETTFGDPITLNIEFHDMATGLGRSVTRFYRWTYTSYLNALFADATSSDDATAIVTLVPGATDPILGDTLITLKSANGRAVGLPTPGLTVDIPGVCTFTGDGCVGLNVSETTTGGGIYSLFGVAQHEINELFGLGSSLQSDGSIFQGFISPQDMYRYSAPGTRSFATNPSLSEPCGIGTPQAFFSIDGGATNLNEFNNCNNGGDYGDWITHTPSQVQDAFASGTGLPSMTIADTANIALDVIGYTLVGDSQAVPEPLSAAIFATGLFGIAVVRRRVFSRS